MMTDPYKVLGVSPTATDEQIKDAYRQLARKYHPDNYINNPLADLATEKMKEINEAYDEIQRQRKASGGARQGDSQGGGSYRSQSSSSQFYDIRTLINNGRVMEAEELLDGVPQTRRDGEWYFLKGTVLYSRGWLDSALQHFNTACQMSPSNQEYRAALNQLMFQRQNGYGQGTRGGQVGMSCCDLCATLYCMDCLCNCMGSGC